MALTKIITDTIDLSSDTTALKMPKGTTGERADTLKVDYLVVAGGGAGASGYGGVGGGGGGAGGLRTSWPGGSGGGNSSESTLTLSTSTAYAVNVGIGGSGSIYATGNSGTDGGDSTFASITSEKGGNAKSYLNSAAAGQSQTGGSGGGGVGWSSITPGLGTINQGFDGGAGQTNSANPYRGGGGGGAGSAGFASLTSGNGGNGLSNSITGTATLYAGGGGGAAWGTSGASGGSSIGGNGGSANGTWAVGTAGATNTGSGGGGAVRETGTSTTAVGGDGGSGVVIIRLPSNYTATFTSGVTANGVSGGGTISPNTSTGDNVWTVTATTDALQTVTFSGTPPTIGEMRENTTTGKMEIYTGDAGWRALQQTDQTAAGIVGTNNFDSLEYAGANSVQSITGLNFQPDLVWQKSITLTGGNHLLTDSVRGVPEAVLANNTINQQTWGMGSLDSNGFTTQTNTAMNGDGNASGQNYITWNWKAGGSSNTFNVDGVGYATAAAASMNTGTITPTGCSVNTEAGFSIVKFTGTGNASDTVSHGLGAAPNLVMYKDIDNTRNWNVYVSSAPSIYNPYGGILDLNYAFNTGGGTNGSAGTPSSTVLTFTAGSSTVNTVNALNQEIITYSWRSIPGYSLIGSYMGTGSSTNTPIIYTGFEPAWIMVKCVDSARAWNITDNKRSTTNPRNSVLQAQSSDQEYTSSSYNINFYNDGFQIVNADSGWNNLKENYIFMCFAS